MKYFGLFFALIIMIFGGSIYGAYTTEAIRTEYTVSAKDKTHKKYLLALTADDNTMITHAVPFHEYHSVDVGGRIALTTLPKRHIGYVISATVTGTLLLLFLVCYLLG